MPNANTCVLVIAVDWCSKTLELLQHEQKAGPTTKRDQISVRKVRSVACLLIYWKGTLFPNRWDGKSDTQGAPPPINPPTRRWMTSKQMDVRRSSLKRSQAPRPWSKGINSAPAYLFSAKETCFVLPSWTALEEVR